MYKRYSGIETSYIFPDIIYKKLKDIDTRIEKIFLVENFYSSDTNFAECIVNLKENKLIAWHKDGNTPLFTYANSSEQFYYLIKSYYRLLKMGYHNKKYSFRFLSREEISKRPEKLKNFFTDLGTRNKKFQSLNPCLIYDSRIDDNVLLSNNITINKNIHIKLVNEHEIKTYDIENNKVIIIILNHKIYRKNDYKRQLLEKNLKNKRVIILKPYIFLKNSNINSMKKYVDDVYVIPFKISYKFLKIYINRESPLRDSSRKKAYIDEIIEIANK